VTRRSWHLHESAETTVRIRWSRDDGTWLEVREDGSEPAFCLVDGTGLHRRFASFPAALDAAYRRQAELDGFGLD